MTSVRHSTGTICASPVLSESQLSFRIGLARKRTAAYPLDSMDFIMMDLERPEMCSRHGHWIAGDHTGYLFEFLSCAEGVDGGTDERLPIFFERILRQRRPSGVFGRYAPEKGPPGEKYLGGRGEISEGSNIDSGVRSGSSRLFSALTYYYELTGDWRALEAATGIAERLMSVKDDWGAMVKSAHDLPARATWISEPFARLYNFTRDQRYLDFCAFIHEQVSCRPKVRDQHSHGFLTTLRGFQLAALYTGDMRWNEEPEYYRQMIIDEHHAMPDGCVSEGILPNSWRTEGCSIADWLMLNLNAGALQGDDSAYEQAEKILWNALFGNQFVTGGFGHRDLTAYGYAGTGLEEAWWCCTGHGGMGLTEYARHVVTFRQNTVRVNLLIPGTYKLFVPGQPDIEVTIRTNYPASAQAIIEVAHISADVRLHIHIPESIHGAHLDEQRHEDHIRIMLNGKVGHWLMSHEEGVVLRYGPLVLAPLVYFWDIDRPDQESPAPTGFIPPNLPPGLPELLCGTEDAEGFLTLENTPLPVGSYFDEGPGARCAVGQAAVNVPVRFANGEERVLRFWPLCYNTSNLTYCEVPIVFPKPRR